MAAGTAGNLITYDASGNPAAVATGTATHVLTSNGAGAAPTFQAAAGGGGTGWTLIDEGTASSVSTVVEDGIFTSAYDEYQLVLIGAKTDTDTNGLRLKLRISGSDIADNYALAGVTATTAGGTPGSVNYTAANNQPFWVIYGSSGTGTDEYSHSIFTLWPLSGLEQRMIFHSNSRSHVPTLAHHSGSGWIPGVTSNVDGFKITTAAEGSYTLDITQWRVFGR
jgi:hypothetical protein